jgi:hypothetical protein
MGTLDSRPHRTVATREPIGAWCPAHERVTAGTLAIDATASVIRVSLMLSALPIPTLDQPVSDARTSRDR